MSLPDLLLDVPMITTDAENMEKPPSPPSEEVVATTTTTATLRPISPSPVRSNYSIPIIGRKTTTAENQPAK